MSRPIEALTNFLQAHQGYALQEAQRAVDAAKTKHEEALRKSKAMVGAAERELQATETRLFQARADAEEWANLQRIVAAAVNAWTAENNRLLNEAVNKENDDDIIS